MYFIIKIIVFIILIFSVAVFLKIKSLGKETFGKKIMDDFNNKAIIVIDLQRDIIGKGKKNNFEEVENKIESINNFIEYGSKNNYEIFYITHEMKNNFFEKFLSKNKLIEGTEGSKIDERIKIINQNIYKKNIGDAFSNLEFEKILYDKKIKELFLIGLDGVYCVYNTAIGGMNRGYNVKIIEEATLFSKNMIKVKNKYNKKNIQLTSISEIIN